MTSDAINGPQLATGDIIGGAQQRNDVALLTERHGVPLRYLLHVDSHLGQSYFIVEAYDPALRAWNPLWGIPQASYTFQGSEVADTDPDTNVITSPYHSDKSRKARSWQKIMDTLTRHAEYLLVPRTPAHGYTLAVDPPTATTGPDTAAGPITAPE